MRYIWLIGAAVYLGAIWYIGWDRFRMAWNSMEPVFLIWVGLGLYGALGLRVLKWRFVLGGGQRVIPLYFLSKAGGDLSPSRIGELSPLLIKRHRTPQIAAWIVVDRLLEIAATLVFGALGAIALQRSSPGLMPIVLVAFVCLIVLPVFLITRKDLLIRMAGPREDGGTIRRIVRFLAESSGEVMLLRPKLPVAATLTVAATALDIIAGVLAYRCFGYALSFPLLAAAQCMHGLVSAIPFLPNATGVPYVAVGVFINRIGGVPSEVIAAVITVYVLAASTAFWSTFGIGMWVGGREARGE